MTDIPDQDHEPPPPPAPETRSGGPRLWPRAAALLLFVIAAGGAWVWQHPGLLHSGAAREGVAHPDPAVLALEARVAKLEQRPDPNLAPLTARLDALEKRGAQPLAPAAVNPAPAFDPAPLMARLEALEARTLTGPPSAGTPDQEFRALLARLDAVERTVAEREAARHDADTLAARVDDLEHQISGLAAKESSAADTAEHAARLSRIEAAELALAAGRPLGPIQDAPAALAKFATAAPPTEASLRLAFPDAAKAAVSVSQPDTEGKPFLDRMIARLGGTNLVTVREGGHVVVGNAAADVLTHVLLEAGDLAGAVRYVASLSGAPAERMAAWRADAEALLAARAALAGLARNG